MAWESPVEEVLNTRGLIETIMDKFFTATSGTLFPASVSKSLLDHRERHMLWHVKERCMGEFHEKFKDSYLAPKNMVYQVKKYMKYIDGGFERKTVE